MDSPDKEEITEIFFEAVPERPEKAFNVVKTCMVIERIFDLNDKN